MVVKLRDDNLRRLSDGRRPKEKCNGYPPKAKVSAQPLPTLKGSAPMAGVPKEGMK